MESSLNENEIRGEKTHERVSLFLLGILLFMRLIWYAPVSIYFPSEAPSWWFPIFEIVTYAATAAIVWWERDSLPTYHVDLTALIILIPLKMFSTIVETVDVYGGLGLYWWVDVRLLFEPLAMALLVGLFVSRFMRIRRQQQSFREAIVDYGHQQNTRGLLIGFVCGVCIGLTVGLLLYVQAPFDRYPITTIEVLMIVMFQLGNAAVLEEPLFRGFLWGHLRKRGVQDSRIFIIQAFLFWISHLYYFGVYSISFWVIVPIGSLAMGLVVWKTRSLGASMLTHGLANAIGQIVHYYYFV